MINSFSWITPFNVSILVFAGLLFFIKDGNRFLELLSAIGYANDELRRFVVVRLF